MACFTKRQREKMTALYEESQGKQCMFGWVRPDEEQVKVMYSSGGGGEGDIIATGDELIALFGSPRLGEYKVAFNWDLIKEGHEEIEEIKYHHDAHYSLWDRFKRYFSKPLWDSRRSVRKYRPYISIYDWKSTSCYASRLPSPMSFLKKSNTNYYWCAQEKDTGIWKPLSASQQADFKRNNWEISQCFGDQWSVGSNFKGATEIIQTMLNAYREGYESPPLLNYPHSRIKIPLQERTFK